MSCTVCHSESNVIWGTTTVNGKQALVLNNPSLGFKKVCLGCLGGKGDTALGNGVELLKEQMRAMRQEFEGYIDQLKTQICDLNKAYIEQRDRLLEVDSFYGKRVTEAEQVIEKLTKSNDKIGMMVFDMDEDYSRRVKTLEDEIEKLTAVPAPAPEPQPMEEEPAPQPPATRGRRSTRVSKSKQ
jgi:hypothetical protein